MQYFPADLPSAPPGCVAGAYGAAIRQTELPRDIEYRLFAQVTAALQAAELPEAHFAARIYAVHRNRELWRTLACALVDDGNALPADLRARLISLAIWVGRETARVMHDNAPLQDLIAVNGSIMAGLRPQQAEGAT